MNGCCLKIMNKKIIILLMAIMAFMSSLHGKQEFLIVEKDRALEASGRIYIKISSIILIEEGDDCIIIYAGNAKIKLVCSSYGWRERETAEARDFYLGLSKPRYLGELIKLHMEHSKRSEKELDEMASKLSFDHDAFNLMLAGKMKFPYKRQPKEGVMMNFRYAEISRLSLISIEERNVVVADWEILSVK